MFTCATKELSQDEVTCWPVACAKEETNERLGERGRKFVQAHMQSGGAVIDVSNDSPAPGRHSFECGDCAVDRDN